MPPHAFIKSTETKNSSDSQAVPSGPKVYLLKLVEFNKIELLEQLDGEGLSGGLAGPPYLFTNNNTRIAGAKTSVL